MIRALLIMAVLVGLLTAIISLLFKGFRKDKGSNE